MLGSVCPPEMSRRKTIIAINKARIRSRKTFENIKTLGDMDFDKTNNFEISSDDETNGNDQSDDSASALDASKQES